MLGRYNLFVGQEAVILSYTSNFFVKIKLHSAYASGHLIPRCFYFYYARSMDF